MRLSEKSPNNSDNNNNTEVLLQHFSDSLIVWKILKVNNTDLLTLVMSVFELYMQNLYI